MSTRRTFLLQTLATGSALMWLPGCADGEAGAVPSDLSRALQQTDDERTKDFVSWQKLAEARVEQANARDLTALMQSYTPDAELLVNGVRYTGADIQPQLEQLGFGPGAGGLADARLITDAVFLTESEILHRGRLTGRHVGPMFGFPPLGKDVTIHLGAFRRFTPDLRLASERLVLNLGVLNPDWFLLNG